MANAEAARELAAEVIDEFVARDVVHGRRHRIVLGGELDLAHADDLRAMVERLCGEGATALTLDLGGLKFIDSTGLHVVVTAMDLCASHGCEFRLIRGSAAVQRTFELVGLLDELPFDGRG